MPTLFMGLTREKNRLSISRAGFTLIELLMVISIIGLLSSVILAALSSARQRASFASAQMFADNLTHTQYGNIALALDFDAAASLSSTDLQAVNGGKLQITGATLGTGAPATLIADTSLHGRGQQLNIPTGSSASPLLLTVNNINPVFLSNNFAWGVWYKPTATPGQDGWSPPIIGWDVNASGAKIGANFFNSAGTVTQLSLLVPSGSTGNTRLIPVTFPTNQWAYIAVSVKDIGGGNDQVDTYVNGKLVDTFKPAVTAYTPGSQYITVAGFCCGAITPGVIDDIVVYDSPLLAADIQKLYAAGLPRHTFAQK